MMRLSPALHFSLDEMKYPSFQLLINHIITHSKTRGLDRRQKNEYFIYLRTLKNVQNINQLESLLEAIVNQGIPLDINILSRAITALGHFGYLGYAQQLYRFALATEPPSPRLHTVMVNAAAKQRRLDIINYVYTLATQSRCVDAIFFKCMITIGSQYENKAIAARAFADAVEAKIEGDNIYPYALNVAINKSWKEIFLQVYAHIKAQDPDKIADVNIFNYATAQNEERVAQEVYSSLCHNPVFSRTLHFQTLLRRMLKGAVQQGWVELADDIFSKASETKSADSIACEIIEKRTTPVARSRILTEQQLTSLRAQRITPKQWLTLTFPDVQNLLWYIKHFQNRPKNCLPPPLLMIVLTYLAPQDLGVQGALKLSDAIQKRLLPRPSFFISKNKRQQSSLNAAAKPFVPSKLQFS